MASLNYNRERSGKGALCRSHHFIITWKDEEKLWCV